MQITEKLYSKTSIFIHFYLASEISIVWAQFVIWNVDFLESTRETMSSAYILIYDLRIYVTQLELARYKKEVKMKVDNKLLFNTSELNYKPNK